MRPIPEGWNVLAFYDDREDKKGSAGRDYEKIRAEIKKDDSCIRAYKDGRRWVVNLADSDEFLLRSRKADCLTQGTWSPVASLVGDVEGELRPSTGQLSIALLDLSEKHASLSSKLFEALSTFINKGEDE